MTTQIFVTEAGLEVPAIRIDQMREVDRVAIEEVGPNLYQMMENAGRNLALTVLDRLGDDWASTAIAVLAGTGGNGGGGICAARHLANRGADVTVVISDEERLNPVPEKQLAVHRGTQRQTDADRRAECPTTGTGGRCGRRLQPGRSTARHRSPDDRLDG